VVFQTERLLCQPLSLQDYSDFEEGRSPDWSQFSNLYNHLIEGPSPLPFRIPRVRLNPEFAEIAIVLAIEKATKVIVGSAGFHDFPNEDGMIEIGFGIVPEKQNQGFGKELLHGMWNEIVKRPDVKILRYTVSPTNAPSMHIIESLGFDFKGEQIDEIDGPELIYELSSERYIQSKI
jgi:RimJ/RimL family protein N-acetyltransferase